MIVEEASHLNREIEDLLDIGVVPVYREGEGAIVVLHRILLPRGWTHVLDQWNRAGNVLDIFKLETDS